MHDLIHMCMAGLRPAQLQPVADISNHKSLAQTASIAGEVAGCLARSDCILATCAHVAAPGFPVDDFGCVVEYAQHPDSSNQAAAAAVLRRSSILRHVVFHLEAHVPVRQAQPAAVVQESCEQNQDGAEDSETSEHCHIRDVHNVVAHLPGSGAAGTLSGASQPGCCTAVTLQY